MHVNCDQSFILSPLILTEVSCGLRDEEVEDVKKSVICLAHDLFVLPAAQQSIFCISCPNQLNSKNTDLALKL